MISLSDLRKRKWFAEAFSALGFIVVALVLVVPYLTKGEFFLGSDGVSFFATKKFYIDSLFSGDFAFWTKYLLGGMPSEIGGTITYPPIFIFGLLPLKTFVTCYYGFHLAFGAYFTYKYLAQIKCNNKVAFVVAVLYECSIHLGGLRKDHIGIITAVTILPMILFFAQKYLDEGKFKWLAVCAFGMSMQVSANVFQQAFYTDVLLFFYIVFIALINKTAIKKLIKDVVLWVTTYIGMSALVLVPTAMIISYLSSMAENNSYDNFLTLSINYYKMLQMIFPKVYGDIYGCATVMDSSEMNIELFLGTLCFAILLFTVIRYRKIKMVRISSVIMLISLIYASVGHIPYLRMLVYVIPVIGGFRVPSRALFIFIFFAFVLIAIGISQIFQLGELKLFTKRFLQGALVVTGLVVLFGVGSLIYINVTGSYSLQALGSYMLDAFLPSIAVTFAAILLLRIILKVKIGDNSRLLLFSAVLIMVTCFEVLPFQTLSNSTPYEYFDIDEQTIALRDDLGDSKVLDAYVNQYNGTSIVSNNMGAQRGIASINAYVPFNYPNLFRMLNEGNNCMLSNSGVMIGSPLMGYTLKYENDALSMLGVEYIIDTSGLLGTNSSFVTSDSIEQEQIFEASDIVLNPNIDGLFMWQEPIELEPYTDYKIDIVLDVHPISGEMIMDFYGGRTYDFAEQNYNCAVRRGETHVEAIFNSGDTTQAIDPINIRVYSFDGATRDIVSVQVERISYETDNYLLYDSLEDGTAIYENPNVNDVLYVPERVEHVDSFDTMLNDLISYDFKDVAYVEEDVNMSIDQGDTSISNIDFSNNRIVAQVSSESDSFIMFSQSYYPGWRVYIDGEEATLYCVSGTIMGAKVPSGDYEIRFEYIPIYSYNGLGITGATFLALISFAIVANVSSRRRKKSITSSTNIKTTVKET